MKIVGEPKAFLSNEALQLLNLYESLGERAEIFLPRHIFDNLTSFVSLCMEEPDDPARQQAEINRYLLKFREDIPGYTDVSLMLIPHNNSKAFELSSKRGEFVKKINSVLDTDGTTTEIKNVLINIRDSHDLSVGTPPINSYHIDFMSPNPVRRARSRPTQIPRRDRRNGRHQRSALELPDGHARTDDQPKHPLHDKSRNLRLPGTAASGP